MKKLFLSRMMLVLLALAFVMSCSKDEDNGPSVLLPKLDGFYIYGTNTVATGPSEPSARMNLAVLDENKPPAIQSKDGVYGKVLYLGANSTLNFAKVDKGEGIIYGAEDGGTISNGKDLGFSVDDDVINGMLKADAPAIKVLTEGLYYAYADVNSGQFIVMPIKPDIIGAATPGGWANGTALPQVSVSKDSAVYQASMHLEGGDTGYRYRLSKAGWAVYEDASIITLSSFGVFDYGVAWDTGINDIDFFISNIPQKETGEYVVKLKYTASTNTWAETKIRDYSTTKVGMLGNAWADGTWSKETAFGVKVPTKAGNVYTWTWDQVSLIADREFVVLENADWGGVAVVFNDNTARSGNAFIDNNIIKATDSENFHVATEGSYKIELKLNAVTGAKTLMATKL